MNRIPKALPILGLLAGFAMLAFVQFGDGESLTNWQNSVAERIEAIQQPAQSSQPVSERVVDLPEDGHLWQTTIVYATEDASDMQSRRLKLAFETEPRLQSLKQQTQFREFGPNSRYNTYQLGRRFALPCVFVHRPNGQPGKSEAVYRASGDGVPLDAKTLGDEIAVTLATVSDCRPKPTPPTPQPSPQPLPDIRPNIGPAGPLPSDDDLGTLAYVIIAASAAGAAYYGVKKE